MTAMGIFLGATGEDSHLCRPQIAQQLLLYGVHGIVPASTRVACTRCIVFFDQPQS